MFQPTSIWVLPISAILILASSCASENSEELQDPPTYEGLPFTLELPRLDDNTPIHNWRPKDCPLGYMAEFGRDNCISIGDPCPEQNWPESIDAENVIYVSPNGTGNGTSPEEAAGDLASILENAPSGATIVLSKGTFETHLEIKRGVHVVGTCAKNTIIQPQSTNTEHHIVVDIQSNEPVILSNVSITSNKLGIVIDRSPGPINIDGVIVDNNHVRGISITNSKVTIQNTIIQNTKYMMESLTAGLLVADKAKVDLSNVHIRDNDEFGIWSQDEETSIQAVNLIVSETNQIDDGSGHGLNVLNDSEFNANKILVFENQSMGMLINYRSKSILEDAVFVDNLPKKNQTFGRGLEATTQSNTTLRRAFFSQNHDNGIGIYDANTLVEGYDVVVADTQARPYDNRRGRGIHISHAAIGNFTRTLVENNRQVGIYMISYYGAEGLQPKFTGTDVLIRGTLPSKCFEPDAIPSCDSLQEYGDGFVALGTAQIELNNVHVIDNHRVGLWFYDTTDSGFPESRTIGSPEVTANGGEIRGNQYGINIRGEEVTRNDFSGVACYENDKTVDGCYSSVELSVPQYGP